MPMGFGIQAELTGYQFELVEQGPLQSITDMPTHHCSSAPPSRSNLVFLSLSVALAMFSTGCATTQGDAGGSNLIKETFASDDPCSSNARNIGIAAGAVLGGILESALRKNDKGVPLAGMLIGATLGGFIGHDMDRRRCDLAKVAKANHLEVVMAEIKPASAPSGSSTTGPDTKAESVGMSFTVIDRGIQFETGSAEPSEAAKKAFSQIAEQYRVRPSGSDTEVADRRNAQMRILLVGHTDDTGSSELNADLSEKRAKAIANIFAQHGFTRAQIFYQGAGEVFPIGDNRTDEGRARNRRVEIVDLSNEAAFTSFLESRKPNLAFYRPDSTKAAAQAAVTQGETKDRASDKKGTSPSGKNKPAAPVPDHSTTASVLPTQVPSVRSPLDNIDLGGSPANGKFYVPDIGKIARANAFSIVSSAYASDDAPIGSCAEDRPRVSRGVKSLNTGAIYKTSEYLPGTATASWGDTVNGHYIGMSNVAVLRDGGQPASRPTFSIWKNYVKGARPDYVTTPEVNAYQGDKALLYRAFFTDGPLRCLDMVIPNRAPSTAPDSNIVYARNNALHQVTYSPRILR